MKNFDWTQFTCRIAVKAPCADLYKAWTRRSELEKWFLSHADFFDKNNEPIAPSQSLEAGMAYAWQWFAYDGTELGEIMEANGKNLLKFSFAGSCLVTIHLTEKDNYTFVELTQENIPEDEESKVNVRLGCESGWSFYLVNLKSVYEGGLDLRNRNTDFKPVVNG